MSSVNAVTIFADNLQGANLVVGNTVSNLTITANSIAVSVGNVTVNSTTIKVISPVSSTQNTTINSTALAANTLKLNGVDYTGVVSDILLVDYQVFTNPLAANFWYKPAWAQANDIVTIQMWGGGGGGGGGVSSGGGGGGACVIVNKLASDCNAQCNVIVGAGGTINQVGGSSIFYFGNSSQSITAYGGGGANSITSAGGGGWFSAGAAQNGGAPLGGTSSFMASTFGGGAAGGVSVYGGGGGGGTGVAGNSVYGGGGGTGTAAISSSIFGGAGGNNTTSASPPGGGGGSNTSLATGARGEVRIWVTGQARSAGEPLPYYFITPNTSTIFENDSVQFTISTFNVANGTTLYYTLNNSSQALSNDFTTAVNGSVVINGGSNTFILTANNDADSNSESFYMDLRTTSSTGTIVANSSTISLEALKVEFVVIAGGGSVSNQATLNGGGGGAGGYRSSVVGENSGGGSAAENILRLLKSTSYNVTIGAGGAAGSNGSDTIFHTITSVGGGRGGIDIAGITVFSGGSGGGRRGDNSSSFDSGGDGTAGQGFAGGGQTANAAEGGGGGGGAGAAGTAGAAAGGNGGAGVASSITGSSVTRATGGRGSTTGGVTGSSGTNGNGSNNTGDGAGKNGTTSINTGGSGVVILRYPSEFTITVSAGLTSSTTTVGSNKVTTITAGTGTVSWS